MTQRDRVLAALQRGPVNTSEICGPGYNVGPLYEAIAAVARELGVAVETAYSVRKGTSWRDVERSDNGRPQETVETVPTVASDIGPSTVVASLCSTDGAAPREADPPPGATLFDAPRVSGGYRDTERAA